MSIDCYCGYESPTVYRSSQPRARKEYACYECGGRILPEERHESHFGVACGSAYSGRTCIKCVEIREWVTGNIPCFCWAHGNMIEDARSAVDDAWDRAPEETIGLRFGLARRVHGRKLFNASRRQATP